MNSLECTVNFKTRKHLPKSSSSAMNAVECANCVVHGWKQVEDKTKLQRCNKCNLIFYCGKECQAEHRKTVHKRHCKYFADPTDAQKWPHKSESCSVCFAEPSRKDSKLKQANNPRYYCVQRLLNMCTLQVDLHPHPFPAGGHPGDAVEKAVIVLQQLVFKFDILQGSYCEELMEACFLLSCNRLRIWRKWKMFPQPQVQRYRRFNVDNIWDELSKVEKKIKQFKPKEDPFQLWEIILQIHEMFIRVAFCRGFHALKDPLTSLHVDFRKFVTQGLRTSAFFLSVANHVLDALASQVIPYQDVLKILCGGSLKQRCTFCSLEIVITGVVFHSIIVSSNSSEHHVRPEAFFDPMFVGMFSCGRKDCRDTVISMKVDFDRFVLGVTTLLKEREGNRCDFCFLLPPTKDVHRCDRCRTKMYCSVSCMDQDRDVHKLGCKEEGEERKVKPGRNVRRKKAMEAKCKVLDKFANMHVESPINVQHEVCSVLNKLKYAKL